MEQRCISVSTLSSGSHVLHFADGSTYEADLVIGADGIKSVIREFVSERPTSLTYSNSVAYRSVVSPEALKSVKTNMMRPLCWIGKDKTAFVLKPTNIQLAHHNISRSGKSKGLSVLYYILKAAVSNTEKINLVVFSTDSTVPIGSVNVPLPWAKPASQEELLHEFSQAGCGEDVNIILQEMKNPSKWYLHFLHPPLSSYVRQRVVLVGDAAHAMLPHLGSGVGQGFEDVYALCALLGDARARKCHLDDALKAYDSIRVTRANMVHKMSTVMGNIVEKRGPDGGTITQIQKQLRDIYHPIWHHDFKEEVKRAVAGAYGPRGVL
ncbi:hypothetical protein C0995_000076 [Termitomyces sp. Mi166|nr:hypothetical protein C0995_000076 [Termitomyces sp. Mi166\